MVPQRYILIPRIHEDVTLHGKRDFADGIALRILGWEDYSRLSGWAEYSHKGSYKFKKEAEESEPEEAHVTTEAEVRAMPLLTAKMQEGAMSQGVWAALDSGIGKKKRFSSGASRKDTALMTL